MIAKASRIAGLGVWLPPQRRGNDHWPSTWKPLSESARRKDILALERTSGGDTPELAPEIVQAMRAHDADPFRGARFRHVIDDGMEVSDMEALAARAAMADAQIEPQEIDLVLVASPVPDRILPGNGPALAHKCGLVNAVAWNYEVGCAVFLPMLVTADALIRTGAYKNVLVVASSALTRVLDYTAPMSAAFGDGAAAAVITAGPDGFGLLGHWMRTDGALREGAVFAPVVQGQPVRAWTRANGEVRLMSFDPDAIKNAGRQAVHYCKEACAGALQAAGKTMNDMALYVGAQSQGWFVEGCRLGLGLPAEKTIDTFAEVANIGPATLLFNLHQARSLGRLHPGDHVLMYSPGVGLTRAAACYRVAEPA
ncbi:MAG: 3-oxoacyl-[acyl-carrier-protein] synthase III C-terminal domain-containing protein [Deltaproteobacteria bacterium]|nr:3-oxoacyl-[acyl-carrier-protein] synthase III C-terminal domain-containing protein [Deltaproteobacteria bacterium]